MMLIIAIIAVIIVVVIQLLYFFKTRKEIIQLKYIFPNVNNYISIVECSFVPSMLNDQSLKSKMAKLPLKKDEQYNENGEEYFTVSLLKISEEHRREYPILAEIIDKTNVYLCKNHGTSADLEILKDICEEKIATLESSIQNSLNVPLYCGLAGTFVGIIVGLWGIDLDAMFKTDMDVTNIKVNNIDLKGIEDLLKGVICAMFASLAGLIMTVKNTAISIHIPIRSLDMPSFKDASRTADEQKDIYYDFIRRELMPILAHSMASSLNSLRNVLGHFVDNFGTKLNDYADTAGLLNDNLDKQQEMLEAINKLNLVKTASKVSEIFLTLKDSSDSLNIFYQYQQQLNSTITAVTSVVSGINGAVNNIGQVLSKFDNLATGLDLVLEGQHNSSELQQQFKESLETHFPKSDEGREIWRKEFDALMEDAQNVSKELSNQLSVSTQYVQNFVSNNKEFFESFSHMRDVIATLTQYADRQSQCYNDLRAEIIGLRSDFKGSKIETNELHKTTLEAINTMNSILQAIKQQ